MDYLPSIFHLQISVSVIRVFNERGSITTIWDFKFLQHEVHHVQVLDAFHVDLVLDNV